MKNDWKIGDRAKFCYHYLGLYGKTVTIISTGIDLVRIRYEKYRPWVYRVWLEPCKEFENEE